MDFTDPQDTIRNTRNVKDLTYNQWLFRHPSAYNLINLGINGVGIFTALLAAAYILIFLETRFVLFIIGFLLVVNAKQLITKIKDYKYSKNTTYYDMWVREYPTEETKQIIEVKEKVKTKCKKK